MKQMSTSAHGCMFSVGPELHRCVPGAEWMWLCPGTYGGDRGVGSSSNQNDVIWVNHNAACFLMLSWRLWWWAHAGLAVMFRWSCCVVCWAWLTHQRRRCLNSVAACWPSPQSSASVQPPASLRASYYKRWFWWCWFVYKWMLVCLVVCLSHHVLLWKGPVPFGASLQMSCDSSDITLLSVPQSGLACPHHTHSTGGKHR